MILVALSDVHGDVARVPEAAQVLAAADAVLVSGDLTQFGGFDEARAVVEAIRPHAKRLLAVPGNCDRAGVLDYLESEGLSVHGRVEDLGGIAVAGAGYSLPCPGRTPGEIGEDDFERILADGLAALPEDRPFVLLTHTPPLETPADLSRSGRHGGSGSVRRFIETHAPLASFCGHIHEARGVSTLGATAVLNPGPLSGGHLAFLRVEAGRVLEAEIRAF